MISWARCEPIPWMYCNATTTRLLVGMLTPAMRATALLLLRPFRPKPRVLALDHPQRRSKRALLHALRGHNAKTTPPSFEGPASLAKLSPNGCGVLLDSASPRQPPRPAIAGVKARTMAAFTASIGAMPSTDLSSPFFP